jgi:hypothetical protein
MGLEQVDRSAFEVVGGREVTADPQAGLSGSPPNGCKSVALEMNDDFRELVAAIERLALPRQRALIQELRRRLGLG